MKIETANALPHAVRDTEEAKRLSRIDDGEDWRAWGPYLSERQWGTIREDYSADGDAWNFFPHDHARSRAYRWGEDGIGGFADESLRLCLALALWNGRDPIVKERLFGLANEEGNHGEDVKELYYFLDGLPSHAYMRMLYKYPQAEFPYSDLVTKNAARGLDEREFEVVDTGVFDDGRYFDVELEYAKASTDDLLLKITAYNRGDAAAPLHLLPQLWARNTWSWSGADPTVQLVGEGERHVRVTIDDHATMHLSCEGSPELLFCDNETNTQRLFGTPSTGWFKDGVNDYLVAGRVDAINPARRGTKVAAHYRFDVPAHGHVVVRVRLAPHAYSHAGHDFDAIVAARRAECDAFYDALQFGIDDADTRLVQRQAFAGLLWCKQFYAYDVRRWLAGDRAMPRPTPNRANNRNREWRHLVLHDIISMPDNWEYPWFATWDLAFHCIALALIDPAFAKAQLVLLLQARSQHPNGELPAYEWDFGAANPPVHAFAALQIYEIDRLQCGHGDLQFLERVLHKLALNFTWWVNREDADGRNVFQGGFLGLDNIALFDRSVPMPDGSTIDQSDATAWMAMYALNLMRIAMELAVENPVYEDLATKFFEHFLYIAEAAHAMIGRTGTGLWDDEDGFYYDVLHKEGSPPQALRVRSMVGLIPLLAVEVLSEEAMKRLPQFAQRLVWFLDQAPELARLVSHWSDRNENRLGLLSLMRRDRMNRVLARMLDENEFLSDFGIRSVSKYHLAHPFTIRQADEDHTITYEPGEGRTRLFGGNSNWRGPIWMPLNYMLIESLFRFHSYYGDAHRIDYPAGSGEKKTLAEIAIGLSDRLKKLFLADADGRRANLGDSPLEQDDPHFRDRLLFHEYFHGDTGRGLGASHQTGWTALIAVVLHPRYSSVRREGPLTAAIAAAARRTAAESAQDDG